ncbi:MAG TPA: hypothetical protein VGM39_17190 [Kofleriaceae bacterium]
MRRWIAAALLAPLAGCSMLIGGFGRRENIECHDYAYSALLDLATAAVVGGISYAENGGTGGMVVSGAFVASSLVGFTGSVVCDAREQRKAGPAVYYPRGSNEPPESLRLDPQTDGVRDATPEEMGLVPGRTPATDLTVHPDPTPPDEETVRRPELHERR